MNVQPLLIGGNGVASDLHVVLSETSDSLLVFLDTALLERIRCSREALQYKMLVGRLANAGWALSELQRAFGHDPRTVKKWAAALQSEDVDEVVRAFGGRGQERKVTAAVARYVKQRYRELSGQRRDFRRTVAEEVADLFGERLSREVLRRLFREADREDPSGRRATVGTAPGWVVMGCPDGGIPGAEPNGNDNRSPEAEGELPDLPTVLHAAPSRPVGVHHAGLVLFLVLFMTFVRGRRSWADLQRQWLGQVLQGAVNLEQSRMVTATDLARFTGSVVAGVEAQRERLRELAGVETVMELYAANARLLEDGPGRGTVFYYDPHGKEYTGQLTVLKGWCGRRHGIVKVLYLDAIHSERGRACFVQHYSPYYDLRERFFMTMELFNRLFPPEQRRGRTFVLDRGIYGLEEFGRFIEAGDHVLTWEKGYTGGAWQEGAPTVVFARQRTRNHARDLRHYRFECQESPWPRDPRLRRIVVRATNPQNRTLEVSVLCSNPDLALEKAVWLMFNRWLQENDFRYLDRHFGLNQLTSYASRSYAEEAAGLQDKPVDSVEYRELKSQLHTAENTLAKHLLRRERQQDRLQVAEQRTEQLREHREGLVARMRHAIADLQAGTGNPSDGAALRRRADRIAVELRAVRGQASRARKALASLDALIGPLKQQTADLEGRLADAVRSQSRLQLLVDNHYRLLDSRCKATLDAVRIAASNMFAALAARFRPLYGNHRNDHVMLRHLTRADGFLHRDGQTVYLRLWLRGRFQNWQTRAFRRFLAQASEELSRRYAHTGTTVRITLLERPASW